ncbi:competence protein CoiA [Lentilactobacillus sp. IMAU92037]|uniref:competence protein CoiA n=1 Tax=Lentilactobacillus dabitei TaxID=2831523 RepID=UPI001C259199|nr:competence protein CoiA family protein [Lentilactobacillus dabitei]MBU9789716.1 competence protein CoiA [Lentilactobacillus dabitei]MBV0929724.1 competence protein CoiA [Lentilactobacillus dabitei]
MIVAMSHNQLVSATSVGNYDQGDFICPCCRQPVIYKHGQYRIPHFSHKSKLDCVGFSENESQTHLKGKLMFKQQVEAIGHLVEIEATMMSIEQRADVFLPNDQLVLEYQCSPISFSEIARRTRNYRSLGYDVIWILGDRRRTGILRSEAVAKFARFHPQLGFYIIFYSVANNQFWLYFQLRELAGKIVSQARNFSTLAAILKFVQSYQQPATPAISLNKNRTSLLNQLKRIQQSIVLKNNTYRDMVTKCYESGRIFVGCPMICHSKQGMGVPLFKRTILCWKVWLVLQLFESGQSDVSNDQLNDLFVQSVKLFGRQMAQVDNYVRFFQIEFTNFIIALRTQGYVRHTIDGIKIVRQPEWFSGYDQKRRFIMTSGHLM